MIQLLNKFLGLFKTKKEEPTNSILLVRLNEINKKLDKLLFTQEIVDRLINCDEVNFDAMMTPKNFEDLFPKPKICKKLKTNVPKK